MAELVCGDTPLVRSDRLGRRLGLERLWLKVEAANPTGSFKDRGAAVAVAAARREGHARVLTASSGNAGAALAAYAAAAGMECAVMVDPGAPDAKLRQIQAYGATVVRVAGLFDRPAGEFIALLRAAAVERGAYLAFFWEPVNPAIMRGFETIATECAAQLGGAPDVVLVPTGGGDGIVAQARAYAAMWREGRIDRMPAMVAVQPEGASPLVAAFETGAERVGTFPHPATRASGLRAAFSGDHALRLLRDGSGLPEGRRHLAVRASEDAIERACAELAAGEGLWIEPSGAAAVAPLADLVEAGAVGRHDTVVAVLTGAGWKD